MPLTRESALFIWTNSVSYLRIGNYTLFQYMTVHEQNASIRFEIMKFPKEMLECIAIPISGM